jgi:HK97 family phage major capsid protein
MKKLRESIVTALGAGRAILDKAEKEGRSLSAEETAAWDKAILDVRKFKDELSKCEEQVRLEDEFRAPASSPIVEPPGSGEAAQRSGKEEMERRVFCKLLREGKSALSDVEIRALQIGPSSSGGYLVPVEFAKNIILKLKDEVFVRSRATVLPMINSDGIGNPALDTEPADATWTSEVGTGEEETTIAFGRREMKPHPLAKLLKSSKRLLRAAAIDVETLIRDRFAYKFGITEEKAFLTGSGAEQPLGLFIASANGINTDRDVSTGNTTTAITGDGLQAAKFSLKKQYRRRAEWIFHRDALSKIAQLKDGQGRYIFQPGLQLGSPDTLLGHPFNESEYAPNTFTTGLYVGLFGDLSFYWIVDSLAMEIQPLYELYAASNQVGFIARKETDGMPVLGEAFARVKLA